MSSIRTQRRGTRGLRKNQSPANSLKKMNKWLAYKAEALGKQVVHQDPRYTSQKCNVCKHIKRTNRNKSRFCCKN